MTFSSDVDSDLEEIKGEFSETANHTTPAGTVTAITIFPLSGSVDTSANIYSDNKEDQKLFMSYKSEITVAEGDKITYDSKDYKVTLITAQDNKTQTYETVYKTKEKAKNAL